MDLVVSLEDMYNGNFIEVGTYCIIENPIIVVGSILMYYSYPTMLVVTLANDFIPVTF